MIKLKETGINTVVPSEMKHGQMGLVMPNDEYIGNWIVLRTAIGWVDIGTGTPYGEIKAPPNFKVRLLADSAELVYEDNYAKQPR